MQAWTEGNDDEASVACPSFTRELGLLSLFHESHSIFGQAAIGLAMLKTGDDPLGQQSLELISTVATVD